MANEWPKTRASIIFRLKDPADHEAWNLAVEIYRPLLLRYCQAKGLQSADAFDVAQEVLSKLQFFQYQPERGRFRAWLGTVARNQVVTHWRKKRRLQEKDRAGEDDPLLSNQASEPDLNWQQISHTYILQTALQRIQGEYSEDAWRAFSQVAIAIEEKDGERHFVWKDDGCAAEVAQNMKRPVEWVYKTKSRILSRLKEEIMFIAEDFAFPE